MIQQVHAAVQSEVVNPLSNITTFAQAFGIIMNVIMGIGISLTVIYLIFGGIQYIMSRGDQKATQEARQSLTNAVIGFIVVIGAVTIKTILGGALGADNATIDTITPTF